MNNKTQPKNILLVDDDPFLQCLYRKTLEHEGFHLLTVNDGQAAIEKLAELHPDLVILDLMLPKVDGLKVLESIRSNPRFHDLPVVILSNAYLPQVAQKAMKSGATSGVLKSECSPKQLAKIIHGILQAAEAKDSQKPAAKLSQIPAAPGLQREPGKPEPQSDPATETDEADTLTATEAKADLLKSWPADIAMLRGVCLKYAKSAGTQEAEEDFKEIYRRLRLLSARSTMAGWSQITELSSALEAMLFERGFNSSKRMSQSTVQTMFQAMDGLEYLLRTNQTSRAKNARRRRILLVDDDPICNCANELALKRVNFETVCVANGVAALALLEDSPFDLVLMDVNMPVLSGLETCERLRELPGYKDVPVIFVTMQDDFKSRAQSVLCGGNGMIAKPISPLELIVKSLIFLLHPQHAKVTKMAKVTTEAVKALASPGLANPPPAPVAAITAENRRAEPPAPLRLAEAPVAPSTPLPVKKAPGTPPPATPASPARTTEEQAADCARLMGDLEAALAAAQKEKDKLARQAATAGDDQRPALQAALAENEQKQELLAKRIEEAWLQFETQQQAQPVSTPLVLAEPPANRPELTDKIKELTEALSAQTGRRESAEQQAASLRQQRNALEAELATSQQTQSQLRAELVGKQQLLDTGTNQLAGQAREFETCRAAMEKKLAELAAAVAAEQQRYETTEQQLTASDQQRKANEADLAAISQAQTQLRAQLDEQQKLLASRTRDLEARSKELEDTRAAADHHTAELTQALADQAQRCETLQRQAAATEQQRQALEQELAVAQQVQPRLQAQLDEQQQLLAARTQDLEARSQDLAAARAVADQQAAELTQALADRSQRCEALEQQAASIEQQRKALEQELADAHETRARLQTQFDEQCRALEAKVNSLETLTQDLAASRAAQDKKAKELAEALATAIQRGETAEHEAADSQLQRKNLESELAASKQAMAELQVAFAEQQQTLDTQVGKLAGQTAEMETTRAAAQQKLAELAEALAAAAERAEGEEARSASLATEKAALESEIAASHQAQAELRRLLDTEVERLTTAVTALEAERATGDKKIDALTRELAAGAQVETQLRARMAEQKQALEEQTHTLNVERSNLKGLEATRSALEEKIQTLTQGLAKETRRAEDAEAEASEVSQLKAQSAQLEREAEAGRRELAGLRYAILDASRMNALLQRQGTQQDRQKMDAMRQMAMLLTQTPLSLAQHSLLADLQSAVDGFKHNRGAGIQAPLYPIELPCFRQSEFSPSKVTESACGPVRLAAEAAGVAVRISITGPAAGRAKGNAEHLHQLITLLAVSPLTLVSGIDAIDLRAAWNAKDGTVAELDLRIALTTKEKITDLLNLLVDATTAVPASQAAPLSTAEFGLAAGWQLALALGARTRIEVQNGKEACLLVAVPLDFIPETTGERNEPPPVTGNSHAMSHGHTSRNAKEDLLVANPI